MSRRPTLAFTQGDPAGVGPEILAKLLLDEEGAPRDFQPLLIAERRALDGLRPVLPGLAWERLQPLTGLPTPERLADLEPGVVALLDPVAEPRSLTPGRPGAGDGAAAIRALDAGIDAVEGGLADALVTAPLSKEVVSRHHLPGFVGHTDYLAERAGLEHYGRDYLMAFLAPRLKVALLSTHLPLRDALDLVDRAHLGDALRCLHRHAPGRIAVAGLNPHAGEGGLLGAEDDAEVAPAVAAARGAGIDAHGPESADSLFARAQRGEFDWVLSLYHDQGLIAVKTAAFGKATNWTLGLPYLRTSVDHGTAYAIAGQGVAEEGPLRAVVDTTLELLRDPKPA